MLKRALILIFFTLASSFASAQPVKTLPPGMQRIQAVEGITEYRLANGLQVLLAPDDAQASTTVNVTYRVGSRHENYGETGMAHLLEHLMFKGSRKFPLVWAEFNKRGLAANGTTAFDRTNYFASFASNEDNLKWYLSWQADAMVNSFIARKDLDSEMTVVRNEMEMGENDAGRMMLQRAMGQMFDWHNYGKVTIGARSDVENVDIARLQAFYRRYYQPDNATLIVSGKFDAAKTLGWISQSFNAVPRPRRALPKLYTLDPVQDGERSFILRRSGGGPMLLAGYHMPAASDERFAAVEALALILGDEPSGRLHRRLVQRDIAAGVWAWAWDLADPGVFMLGTQLGAGQDADVAAKELLAVTESFVSEPVTADELTRAKAQWLKSWNQHFSDAQKVGLSLSDSVAQGDWRLFFLLRDRVQALTLEQVQRVALDFLLPSNRTLGRYVPTDKPQRAPVPVAVDVAAQFRDFKPQSGAANTEAFDATPSNIDARTRRFDIALGGGDSFKVALLPKPTRGAVVHATLSLGYGDEKSLAGQGAAFDLLGAMLDKGSTKLSRQQVRDRLDELQSELTFGSEAGRLTVNITSKKTQLPAVITLAGELLRQPAFSPEVLDELRRQAIAGLEASRGEPEAVIENMLARQGNPYPKGDVRYARSFDEAIADLRAVTVEQLRNLHGRLIGASFAQFAAVGDMDVPAVRSAVQAALADWKSPAPYARVAEPLVPVSPVRLQRRIADKQNAVFSVRQAIPLSDNDADYAAFTLANWLLGGSGGDSRLWKRIRETEGLSYGVQTWVAWNSYEANSNWNTWAIFAPGNRAKVEAAFGEEVARALKDGFTDAELKSGINGLLSFRRLSRAQDARLASGWVVNLQLGRTFAVAQRTDEAITKLTLSQVNAALRKYLQPERFVSAVVGDFKE